MNMNIRSTIRSMKNGQHPSYKIVVKNGQRVTCPINNDEFESSLHYEDVRSHEVILKNIPQDVKEDDLIPFVCQAGPIYQIRLLLTFSLANRGIAFVTYGNVDSAYRAIQLLNGQLIKRTSSKRPTISVEFAVNNNRLKISGIPKHIRSDELDEKLKIHSIRIIKLFSSNHHKLEAIVECKNHQSASNLRRLFAAGLIKIDGHSLNASWARPVHYSPAIDAIHFDCS